MNVAPLASCAHHDMLASIAVATFAVIKTQRIAGYCRMATGELALTKT